MWAIKRRRKEEEKKKKTYITSSHILHVGHVVVNNFQEPASLLGNVLHHVLQRLLGESLRDTAGVDRAHGVVGPSLVVPLNGNLHGQTTIEHHRYQALDGHDVGQGGQGRVFTERVASKAAVPLHQALGPHIFETGLLHQGQGRLSELGGGEQTGRGPVGIRGSGLIDALEDLLRLDRSIGIHRLESHRHVVLADGLAPWATEVDGQLLGVVLDDVDD